MCALAALCAAACSGGEDAFDAAPPSGPPRLVEAWRLDGLANPESVAINADGAMLYVTNVDGEADARDGSGFVSLVSVSGQMLQRDWVTGLDAPKGIARFGDALYVADIDRLVVIAADTGTVRTRVPIEGAQFLNDVAVTPDGMVLVSDSGSGRIFAVRDGEVTVFAEGPLLESVNGLYVEDQRLVAATMEGRLVAIYPATREIILIAEGLGQGDGVAPYRGGYLVSEWPGALYYVGADSERRTLQMTRDQNIYQNDFLVHEDLLFMPNWEPGALTAYRLAY
ncbi:MAG: hypothetical protein GC206_06510 [Alphaproteobacteria bacterium]|nr:hypothetical protein [Alphaproteobacteria bacterium]